ncbi:hypothetical protein CEXT_796611 [Caerostris extrusa]|uniref:Uncharacterized protein n=1 Tax=Caerostris extrusa TaxID=172846 RepID=A0AAV4WTA9_CAEEX|nr:hypothetical protein CEXT_796611 [Caerostris extrusa]
MFPNLMIYFTQCPPLFYANTNRSRGFPALMNATMCQGKRIGFSVGLYTFKEESDNSVNTGNHKLIKRWISFPPALYVNLKHKLISLGGSNLGKICLVLLEDKTRNATF